MLTCLVPVLFTFYIQDVLKLKTNNFGAKGLIISFQYNIESVYFFYSNPVYKDKKRKNISLSASCDCAVCRFGPRNTQKFPLIWNEQFFIHSLHKEGKLISEQNPVEPNPILQLAIDPSQTLVWPNKSTNSLYTVHTTCLPASQDSSRHFKCWKPYAVLYSLALLKMDTMVPKIFWIIDLSINHNCCIKLV